MPNVSQKMVSNINVSSAIYLHASLPIIVETRCVQETTASLFQGLDANELNCAWQHWTTCIKAITEKYYTGTTSYSNPIPTYVLWTIFTVTSNGLIPLKMTRSIWMAINAATGEASKQPLFGYILEIAIHIIRTCACVGFKDSTYNILFHYWLVRHDFYFKSKNFYSKKIQTMTFTPSPSHSPTWGLWMACFVRPAVDI